MAYGQYSSFGSQWTSDLNEFANGVEYNVDREGLGKKGDIEKGLMDHKILQDTVSLIGDVDQKRADHVLAFFNGYYKSLNNVQRNLTPGGTMCIVVGNRTVKNVNIPMDQITASFLDSFNLNFGGINVREITNKVMPARNSPTNVTGATSNTMANEFIVVFKKQGTSHHAGTNTARDNGEAIER